jgi:hypothetical protein
VALNLFDPSLLWFSGSLEDGSPRRRSWFLGSANHTHKLLSMCALNCVIYLKDYEYKVFISFLINTEFMAEKKCWHYFVHCKAKQTKI